MAKELELAEYNLHQNTGLDAGYTRFLSRAVAPVVCRFPGGEGLDFGSGPAPVLAQLLTAAGCSMSIFDKFYSPNPAPLAGEYDFVTATEVVEHLDAPGDTLGDLWQNVRSGGLLLIMTKRWLSLERFRQWHYKNDPTHIAYFHLNTFIYIAGRWRAQLLVLADDLVLIRKR